MDGHGLLSNPVSIINDEGISDEIYTYHVTVGFNKSEIVRLHSVWEWEFGDKVRYALDKKRIVFAMRKFLFKSVPKRRLWRSLGLTYCLAIGLHSW